MPQHLLDMGCLHGESFLLRCVAAPAVEAGEPGSQSVPIKHTRPKVQKFDNGFIIEDTHMGPAQGKVGCPTLMNSDLTAINCSILSSA